MPVTRSAARRASLSVSPSSDYKSKKTSNERHHQSTASSTSKKQKQPTPNHRNNHEGVSVQRRGRFQKNLYDSFHRIHQKSSSDNSILASSNGSDTGDDEENKKPAAAISRKKLTSDDTKKAPLPKLAPIKPDDPDDDSLRPDEVISQSKKPAAKKKDFPLKVANVPIKQEDSEDDAFAYGAIDSSKKGSSGAKKKDPPPKLANVPIKQEDSDDDIFGHNAVASLPNSEDDPVPPPPPLYRVTGHSTLFNTYTATWGPMSVTTSPLPSPSLPHSTGFSELLSANPLFGFAAAHGLTDTSFHDPFETACTELANKKPSPSSESAKSGATGITSMMAQAGLSGSVVSTEEEPVIDLSDPTSRIIQTAHGPALLLSPLGATTPTTSAKKNEPARRFQRWSEEEDLLLKTAIDLEGKPTDWKRVASKYFLNSRNSSQCKGRWKKLNSKRSAWTAAEDKILLECKEKNMGWPEIAKYLPGRVAEQVRERFLNQVDPSLKKTPWTKEERAILAQAQRRLGNKWTEISKLLPGRSENSIKNTWHNAMATHRRALRRSTLEQQRLAKMGQKKNHTDDDADASPFSSDYPEPSNACVPIKQEMDYV